MSGYVVLDVALGCMGVYLISSFPTKSKRPPLPPGPRPKPIVGNLADLPPSGELEWLHWTKHRDLYGPISSVSVFGKTIIIINDLQIAFELLDKRSLVFSDRPVLPFAGTLCGFDNTVVMVRYGDRHRRLRRYLHQYMESSSTLDQHHPIQELETRQLLLRLLEQSDKIQDQIRASAGSLILRMSHGYATDKRGKDPLVALAEDVLSRFSVAVQPGVWVVDFLPFLQYVPDWMPFTGFKRFAAESRAVLNKMVDLPHAFVKQRMASGTYSPSFTSAFLEGGPKSEEDDSILKWAGLSIYAGGADTSVSALYSFFLAMTLYPDVQKAALEEVNRVVGTDRLPNLKDREHLPYVNAVVKETLRWNPVLPLCVPHATSEDSTYNGYRIPKGAVVLPNVWWLTHDPSAYRDPGEFKPGRFLGDKPELDPSDIVFGFGRRICPGRKFAESSLFIEIAMILSVFDISKARDTDGTLIEVKPEYSSGVISHPKEFACSLTPRSERAVQLIRSVGDEIPVAEASDTEALAHVKW